MLKSVLSSGIAGIFGTSFGAVLAILFNFGNKKTNAAFCFSAGIMIGLSLLHLLPEALVLSETYALIGVFGGFILFFATDSLLKEKDLLKTVNSGKHKSVTAALTWIVIALHNLPEGMAIGISANSDIALTTALLIGIHNIPEGISVALPFIERKEKAIKTILYTAAAGAPTLIGAILGNALGDFSTSLIPLSLGISAGAMLSVVIFEFMDKKYIPVAFASGIMVSILLILI